MRAKNAINTLRFVLIQIEQDMKSGVIKGDTLSMVENALKNTQFINYEQDNLPALLKSDILIRG